MGTTRSTILTSEKNVNGQEGEGCLPTLLWRGSGAGEITQSHLEGFLII